MHFNLPEAARTALALLEAAGYEAWLVGGCVRDAYLGRQPGDIDIATSARPEEMLRVFAAHKTIPTGIAHGTITLLLDGHSMEITTYRTDGEYTDKRRPDEVVFVSSIKEDLARRDFTCNAMAYHPNRGLYDPFFGRSDCDARLLRAVGKPARRFEEDALRVLRALRFSCQLGFEIEENTLSAMMAQADGLAFVSKERIAAELNRALISDYVEQALRNYPRVLFLALPELTPMLHTPQRTPFHRFDVWEHTLRTIQAAPRDTAIRWAALYHDSGKPHTTLIDPDGTTHFRGHQMISARLMEEAMVRLKQSKALREQTVALVKYHDDRIGPDNLQAWMSKLGLQTTLKLLRLQWADLSAHSLMVAYRLPQLDQLYEDALRLHREGAPLHIRDLAINGKDLMALGFDADERMGHALSHLLAMVLNGQLDNRRDNLLAEAQAWRAQKQRERAALASEYELD